MKNIIFIRSIGNKDCRHRKRREGRAWIWLEENAAEAARRKDVRDEQRRANQLEKPTADVPITDSSRLLSESKYTNPWPEKAELTATRAPKGFEIEMAMSSGQEKPGRWGTTDHIPNVDYVRNELAVTPSFKQNIATVQKFKVLEGTPIQIAPVGSQVENGVVYQGGGNQVQILNYEDRAKLIPVGEPRPIY